MFYIIPPWHKENVFEWKIEYLGNEDILFLKSKGYMNVSSANALVRDLVDASRRYQCNRHLIDHSDTIMTFCLPEFLECAVINEQPGTSRSFKRAMVFSQLNEDTVFMENVFRNRGFNLRHFADMDEARNWLKHG